MSKLGILVLFFAALGLVTFFLMLKVVAYILFWMALLALIIGCMAKGLGPRDRDEQ